MLPNIRAYLTCPSSGSFPLSQSLSPPNAWHPMFSLVWDPMLCHLGCSHPRTPLPLFKQIKSVFCHFHMLYRVEHMVVAHLTHLLNAMVPKRGRCQCLHFVHFCLFCHPSQPLCKLCSMRVLCSQLPSMPAMDFHIKFLRKPKAYCFSVLLQFIIFAKQLHWTTKFCQIS